MRENMLTYPLDMFFLSVHERKKHVSISFGHVFLSPCMHEREKNTLTYPLDMFMLTYPLDMFINLQKAKTPTILKKQHK